jgi:hypothetical protein
MLAKRKNEWSASQLIDALRDLHVSGADLRNLVQLTRDFVAEDLERRVALAKDSLDGRGLPAEVLRRDIVRQDCQCTAALRWLAHE